MSEGLADDPMTVSTPIGVGYNVQISPAVVGVDEVVREDDDDAGDELVLDEDEEVDDHVVGGTGGSPWGDTSVAGRSAAVVLEVGKEETRQRDEDRARTVAFPLLGRRSGASHVEVDAWGRRSARCAVALWPKG